MKIGLSQPFQSYVSVKNIIDHFDQIPLKKGPFESILSRWNQWPSWIWTTIWSNNQCWFDYVFNLKAHGKSSKLAVRGVISIEIIAKILACLLMRIVTN